MLRLVWMLKLVYSFRILAMEVMPDHIHLLLNCKPQFRISDMVKIMKGNTARWLFLKYPGLKLGHRNGLAVVLRDTCTRARVCTSYAWSHQKRPDLDPKT